MTTLQVNEAVSQYLSFHMGGEVFALPIERVREVLDYTSVTRVPRMPEYMRGVFNVRGSVVPVVDLKLRLDLGSTEAGTDTCIIIIELLCDEGSAVLGLMADSVREVLDIPPGNIEEAPKLGTKLDTRFLEGIAKADEEFIMLLDIGQIFADSGLGAADTKVDEGLQASSPRSEAL